MIDIDLTFRNLYGNVSFGIKSKSVTGIELLIQKVTILLLSENSTNYFNTIVGGELLSSGKYSLTDAVYDTFKLTLLNNLNNIIKQIKLDEANNNMPLKDRIKSLSINSISFDKLTTNLVVKFLLSTNSTSMSFTLPVKQ